MKPSTARACAVAFLCLGLTAAAAPQAISTALFKNLRWVNLGPARAGRSIASTGSAARPLEYFTGATGGQLQSSSVGAVAVAASNPDVVYIGMGEKDLRGNIMQGDGMYKSSDDGKTWRHIGLDDTQIISKIVVDPANPDVVYVAALGHPSAPNSERGVLKSTDGGAHWSKILFRDDKTGAVDLAMDPKNPQILYAALWEAWRTSWGMSSGGPGSGLFKSTDGGANWTEITRNSGL